MSALLEPIREISKLRKLRARAQKTMREVQAKQREMEALIALLNTALDDQGHRFRQLDKENDQAEPTEDLRSSNGNVSAEPIAQLYGISLSALAGMLGKSRQTVSKTPDSDALQSSLAFFERVARLRGVVKSPEAFRKWLRTPNDNLDQETPMELMHRGEWQAVADYVEDMLTGATT